MGKWTVIIKHVEEEDKDKILDEIANLENENEIFCPGGEHVEAHPEIDDRVRLKREGTRLQIELLAVLASLTAAATGIAIVLTGA